MSAGDGEGSLGVDVVREMVLDTSTVRTFEMGDISLRAILGDGIFSIHVDGVKLQFEQTCVCKCGRERGCKNLDQT